MTVSQNNQEALLAHFYDLFAVKVSSRNMVQWLESGQKLFDVKTSREIAKLYETTLGSTTH